MEDAGFIFGGYAVTFGAIALYAFSVLRRARTTAARVPDSAKPWT
jgi:hypothetical protein